MNNIYLEALIIEPMKINKIPKGKEHLLPSLCESGDYFAQLKKDGYWYMYEKTQNYAYLFSRNESVETGTLAEKSANVPHIMEEMDIFPPNTIVIGEVYYPDVKKTSKDITPIMGSLPAKAIERQKGEYGYLHYYVHDIIRFAGVDLTNFGASVRYEVLKSAYEKFNLENSKFITLAERVDENIHDFIIEALDNGEEGVVMKKKTAPYTPGKRPVWDTIKIKKTDTCDAVCMGFCEPTKYYNGKLDVGPNYTGKDAKEWPYWVIEHRDSIFPEDSKIVSAKTVPIGDCQVIRSPLYGTMPVTKAYYYRWPTAMEVGAYDNKGNLVKIGTVSSGLTEALQASAVNVPNDFIGKVVELAGMEKNHEDKTLRHFYFKNFRDDKKAKDCLISEIF
jgi:ATP-dependent DNA ligase